MKKVSKNQLIYESKRQLTLCFVSLLTLALSVFVWYMIYSDWAEFASEYSSKFSAIGWAIFMLIAGNVLFVCMLWLSGRYILQIEQADENHIFIKTWSIIGLHKTKKFPAEILKTAVFHTGITKTYRTPVVIAPYSILKTSSGKKMLIDEQGSWTSEKNVNKKMEQNISYTFRKSAFDNLQHWEIKEQGLLCTDKKTEQKNLIPYSFTQSIRLQFQPYRDFRHNNYRCRITTTNGGIIDILSTSYVGFADFTDEAETYIPFVKALVKKTKSENPNSLIYLGQTTSAYNGNQALILIAIAFALVLILSFAIGQKRLLSLLLIIIGAWQYFRMSKRVHQPQTLDSDEIPDYVLPQTPKK